MCLSKRFICKYVRNLEIPSEIHSKNSIVGTFLREPKQLYKECILMPSAPKIQVIKRMPGLFSQSDIDGKCGRGFAQCRSF